MLKGRQIVIVHVHGGRIIDGIVPHAVVAGYLSRDDVGRSEESVATIPGIGGGNARSERQAAEGQVRNSGIVGVRCVHRDVGIAASWSYAEIGGAANVIDAAASG